MTQIIQHAKSFGNLVAMIKLHSDFEACLDKQVAAGVLACDSAKILLQDYLNETSWLLGNEYVQLKDALAIHISDANLDSTSGSNILDAYCVVDDAKNALSFLSKSWESHKEAVTQRILTDDECCDSFSDMLDDHGIDYSVFIDLCNIGWAATCQSIHSIKM